MPSDRSNFFLNWGIKIDLVTSDKLSKDSEDRQDLSPFRIAHLILHILFLKNSKSVTLNLI